MNDDSVLILGGVLIGACAAELFFYLCLRHGISKRKTIILFSIITLLIAVILLGHILVSK